MPPVTFSDLLSQETKSNPISFFSRWRERTALDHIPDPDGTGDTWIAMNYDDSVAILNDLRFIKERQKVLPPKSEPIADADGSLAAALAGRCDMVRTDPPEHARLRSLVAKALTPQIVEQLRPRVQQITNRLLDAVEHQKKMDVIGDFAFPLPMDVLSQLLGISADERPQFNILGQALLTSTDTDPAVESLLETFLNYLRALVGKKRACPGSDLTSVLVQATDSENAVMSKLELISTIWMLFNAGYDTTVNLIGNGVMELLQHPEQLRLLQRDPTLLPAAIEEILRYTSPMLLTTPRWASEAISMHGKLIRRGERVFVSLIAANTDPQQFADSQRFDITRNATGHLAFGRVFRYCLGAPLARLQGQIAIGTILRRFPGLRLACATQELTWSANLLSHGVTTLPVEF